MFVLHHCPGARSFRPLWALEEMGLPYELRLMAFPPRLREPGYLSVNPLGTTPAFFDDGALMTESSGICDYLARKYGPTPLAVTPQEPAFAAYVNFLYMSDATLTFPQTLVLRYTRLEPEARRLPQAAADYAQWFHSRLRGAFRLIGDADYVAADRFTMADIAVGYALKLAQTLGLDQGWPDPAKRYFDRVSAREGYERALRAETLS
jgi:glutathione S-transferase